MVSGGRFPASTPFRRGRNVWFVEGAARGRAPAGLHTSSVRLPVEGELPSFGATTGWLNSPPLTPSGLRGKVVLTSFWTYTCINWLRQPRAAAWRRPPIGPR